MYQKLKRHSFKLVNLAVVVGVVMAVFPAMVAAQPPSPLNPASPAAESIANLHNIIFWIAVVVFLVVLALLVYAMVKFRRRSDDDEPDQDFHGSATLETIWTLIPVGILVVLMVLTFQTFQDTDPIRPTDLTIEVTGKQWLWEFKYPEYGVSTIGEIYVPVNTDVRLEIRSDDVIHSFWVPQLGGKTDAVPGYMQVAWFKATRLGQFHGQCAEFCGVAHSKMPVAVKVVDQQSFDLWITSKAEQQAKTNMPVEEQVAEESVAELQAE